MTALREELRLDPGSLCQARRREMAKVVVQKHRLTIRVAPAPCSRSAVPQEHLRQIIKNLASCMVNDRYQQRVAAWGDVLPLLKCVEAPGLIGPLQNF